MATTHEPVSLRRRLSRGFFAFAVALALLAVSAVLSLNRLGNAVATILKENYASVIACVDMKEALERLDSAAQFASSGREDVARSMIEANRSRFSEAFAREANNVTLSGEGDLVREIDARYRDYTRFVDATLALPAGERSDRYFSDLLPRFTAIKDCIDSILRMNQANMEDADRETKALARRLVQGAIAASLLAVVAAFWLAWSLPRAIVRPVESLAAAADAIGGGKLDVDVSEPEVVELAPLAKAFRGMLEQLRTYRESSLGELLAAKDVARATLATMLDPVIVFGSDGSIAFANEAAESAFGVEAGAASDLARAGVTVPIEIARARDEAFASTTPFVPRSLSEAMRWQGAGGERYYLVRAARLRTAPNEGPRAIVVAQDVTRFRRIDELKSDMVATVSHEFKTPLTSLRMATHLLLEDGTGPLTPTQRDLVQTAKDDTERLSAMVDELLDVVRIERDAGELKRASIDPSALLRAVADAHKSAAKEKSITIDVRADLGGEVASLDPSRVSIAISNLVSNAIRHTPRGGTVALSASSLDGVLRVEVEDCGPGLEGRSLPDLLRGAGKGEGDGRTGLGLVIAREIALQHGGELTVTSAPNRGAKFALTLPLEHTSGKVSAA